MAGISKAPDPAPCTQLHLAAESVESEGREQRDGAFAQVRRFNEVVDRGPSKVAQFGSPSLGQRPTRESAARSLYDRDSIRAETSRRPTIGRPQPSREGRYGSVPSR